MTQYSDPKEFNRHSQKMTTELGEAPGSENKHFILKWTSKEAGDVWTPIFQKEPNWQALMNALNFSTVRQEHFTVVKPLICFAISKDEFLIKSKIGRAEWKGSSGNKKPRISRGFLFSSF